MPPLPVLRVVPLEKIRRHEELDPFRVDRLMRRISAENIQVNPMVCSEADNGDLVLLDGATRTAALMKLGLEVAVVQIVDPASVTLETWHHVVRDCPAGEVIAAIESTPHIALLEDVEPPRIHDAESGYRAVRGIGISPNAALSALVDSYIGKWTVSRVTDPSLESMAWRFPDWSLVVEFPILTVDDVMEAAVGADHLPAGITRFLVPERALRLNVDLSMLSSGLPVEEKQRQLDEMMEQRAHEGRIRRYEETVFVLDD